jgi:hypothetical protein
LSSKQADVIHEVGVIFRGLLLIRPDAEGTSCDIGVHRRAIDHYLTIAITGKPPSGDDFVIDFHAGPLNGRHFSMRVDPPTGDGVFAYAPTTPPLDRSNDRNDEYDLQWAIDLQSSEFHGEPLEVDLVATSPGIEMWDGVFYTVLKTDESDVSLVRHTPDGRPFDMHSIAHVIGASIAIRAGESLVIEWHESDVPRSLRLPRPGDLANTKYEIYIRNDPPGFATEAEHDELEQYYRVLTKAGGTIGVGDRFRLETRGEKLLTTDRIPCMPILVGGLE